jgi:hypothetical protein
VKEVETYVSLCFVCPHASAEFSMVNI